jgi:hypothetical protein
MPVFGNYIMESPSGIFENSIPLGVKIPPIPCH